MKSEKLIAELRTERLLLRQWKDADLVAFGAMNADPRVMEFFPGVLARDESDRRVDRFRAQFLERGFGVWAVEVPGVTPFVGFVGLAYPHLPPPFEPRVEIGWRLAFEHWGKGYATEAARAALDAAFHIPEIDEIVSMTAVANFRSRRVMEKLGLRHSSNDDFEHPGLPEGHALRRHVLYRLSRNF
jgi:RimJ/RimL family protein N-acetyltransferase